MAQTQNQMPASQAGGASAGGPATERPAPRGRIIFLNALPLNALPRRHIQADILPAAVNELAAWVQRRLQEGYELIHYIRHAATIGALRSLGVPLSESPNSGLYQYQYGDILVIITLRSPPRGQDVQHVNISDLEAWIVTVV